MSKDRHESRDHKHGNVFGRGSGNMFIHVQRENGLAHRTLTLQPWQVQALRLVASRWFAAVLTVAVLSWGYFAFQTARVPFLTHFASRARRRQDRHAAGHARAGPETVRPGAADAERADTRDAGFTGFTGFNCFARITGGIRRRRAEE